MSVHMLVRTFFESLDVTVKSDKIDLSYSCRCGEKLAARHGWKLVTEANLPDMFLSYKNFEADECTDPDFKLFYSWLQSVIRQRHKKHEKVDSSCNSSSMGEYARQSQISNVAETAVESTETAGDAREESSSKRLHTD